MRTITVTCLNCGNIWTPRPNRFESGRKQPYKCPRCQSHHWNTPKEEEARS